MKLCTQQRKMRKTRNNEKHPKAIKITPRQLFSKRKGCFQKKRKNIRACQKIEFSKHLVARKRNFIKACACTSVDNIVLLTSRLNIQLLKQDFLPKKENKARFHLAVETDLLWKLVNISEYLCNIYSPIKYHVRGTLAVFSFIKVNKLRKEVGFNMFF